MSAKNIRELAQGNRNVWSLDPRILKMRDGWNIRGDRPELAEHIQTIANSIVATGYDQSKPLTIFQEDGEFYISDGHCRLLAVLRAIEMGAEIKSVPVIQEMKGVNEADRVAGLITRNSGLPLTPLETAAVYKRLIGFGWTVKQIADKVGKSSGHVDAGLLLMGATPATHAAIVNGNVSASVATAAVREHGPARAQKLIDRAIKAADGKRATARGVHAASSGEPRTKERNLAAIDEFFAASIRDQDVPPGVVQIAHAFLAFRLGKCTDEQFAERLGQLTHEREMVTA